MSPMRAHAAVLELVVFGSPSDSLSVREQDLLGGGRNSLEILCPLREPVSLITVLVALRDRFSLIRLCISTVTWKNSGIPPLLGFR